MHHLLYEQTGHRNDWTLAWSMPIKTCVRYLAQVKLGRIDTQSQPFSCGPLKRRVCFILIFPWDSGSCTLLCAPVVVSSLAVFLTGLTQKKRGTASFVACHATIEAVPLFTSPDTHHSQPKKLNVQKYFYTRTRWGLNLLSRRMF